MKNISKIIQYKYPNVIYSVCDTYDSLQWFSTDIQKPTEDELKSVELELILQDVIRNKSVEIEAFYDAKRVFTIRNGVTMTLKADANYADQVQNWISKLEADVRDGVFNKIDSAIYAYLIPETGKILNVPYAVVLKIKDFIAQRRSYCRANCDFHIGQVKLLNTADQVQTYVYKFDYLGKEVVDCADIEIK